MVWVVRSRAKKVHKDEIEEFENKFPAIFEEFAKDEVKNWLLYFFYVLRRIVLVVFVVLEMDPVLQLIVQAVFSTCVMLI